MRLYIDLIKAQSQVSSTSVDTPTEDQSTVEHDSSYSRRYEGVASGESLDPDNPDVGGKWKHDDEGDNELSEKRKARTKTAQKEGVVKSEALQRLELINKAFAAERIARTPTTTEQEFLREVLGYSQDSIDKGLAIITGRNRSLFSQWLCDKLNRSTNTLAKSVGEHFGR